MRTVLQLQTMGLEVAQRYLETGEWRRRGGGGGQLGREERVWRADEGGEGDSLGGKRRSGERRKLAIG